MKLHLFYRFLEEYRVSNLILEILVVGNTKSDLGSCIIERSSPLIHTMIPTH
jgi:hypothetical protein